MKSSYLPISKVINYSTYVGTGTFNVGTNSIITGDICPLFTSDNGYYSFAPPISCCMLHGSTIAPVADVVYIDLGLAFWCCFINSNTAIGDIYRWFDYIRAGTYNNITFMYTKGPQRGICKIYLDNVAISADIDMYAAGATTASTTISGVNIATSTWHTIDIRVTGKNASSSSYLLTIILLEFH